MHTFMLACARSLTHCTQRHTHFCSHICTYTCKLTRMHTFSCSHRYACRVICALTHVLHSDWIHPHSHGPSLSLSAQLRLTCIPTCTHLHLEPFPQTHFCSHTQANIWVELHISCMYQRKTDIPQTPHWLSRCDCTHSFYSCVCCPLMKTLSDVKCATGQPSPQLSFGTLLNHRKEDAAASTNYWKGKGQKRNSLLMSWSESLAVIHLHHQLL